MCRTHTKTNRTAHIKPWALIMDYVNQKGTQTKHSNPKLGLTTTTTRNIHTTIFTSLTFGHRLRLGVNLRWVHEAQVWDMCHCMSPIKGGFFFRHKERQVDQLVANQCDWVGGGILYRAL